MITIPAPITGMRCDECDEACGGWIATAVNEAYTICLFCFTEAWWTPGVPPAWVHEFMS